MRGCQISLLIILLCPGFTAIAAEHGFDSWTTNDDLPQNSVLATAQTRHICIGLGTFEVLSHFEVVNFAVCNNVNTSELSSNFVETSGKSSDQWRWRRKRTALDKQGVMERKFDLGMRRCLHCHGE